MISNLIKTLLGDDITETDIIEAFSLDHNDFLARPYLNSPNKKQIAIRGVFFHVRQSARMQAGLLGQFIQRLARQSQNTITFLSKKSSVDKVSQKPISRNLLDFMIALGSNTSILMPLTGAP